MNIKTMENKVRVWIARDEGGYAFIHREKPHKSTDKGLLGEWISFWACPFDIEFPSVKWEDDEPTEAYITLAEPQEQPTPKQEIDWEQRRYEIAKDILSTMFFHPKPAINRQEDINFAVKAADMLIKKLKEQGE